jgi:hypothetical protein
MRVEEDQVRRLPIRRTLLYHLHLFLFLLHGSSCLRFVIWIRFVIFFLFLPLSTALLQYPKLQRKRYIKYNLIYLYSLNFFRFSRSSHISRVAVHLLSRFPPYLCAFSTDSLPTPVVLFSLSCHPGKPVERLLLAIRLVLRVQVSSEVRKNRCRIR